MTRPLSERAAIARRALDTVCREVLGTGSYSKLDADDRQTALIELGGSLLDLADEEGHNVSAMLTSFRNNHEGILPGENIQLVRPDEPISFVERQRQRGRGPRGHGA